MVLIPKDVFTLSDFGFSLSSRLAFHAMPRSKFSRADVTFRALLKEWRQEAGMTQAVLSKKLNQPQSFVSKYETGERRLDFGETAIVCNALGKDIQEFAAAFDERLRASRK